MRYRLTTPDDLAVARDMIPAAYRYADAMREELPRIWAGMLKAGQLNTAVVEDPIAAPEECVRGVGLSVFVADDFADSVLAEPAPYLNARLHDMIVAGRSPVLTRRQIAKANTNGGLTLLPLHFATASLDFNSAEVMRTLTAGHDLFRLVHAGYRIRRVVKEVVDANICRFMVSNGMRLVTKYEDTLAGAALRGVSPHDRPCLLAIDHAEMALGTSMSMTFMVDEPRFRFSPAEQRLLQCAILHEQDEDITADLGLSQDTIRKQWRSIYQRVQFVEPEFFPDEPERDGRGRGKRRHLLRYLSLHMEELRPYRKRGPDHAVRHVALPAQISPPV